MFNPDFLEAQATCIVADRAHLAGLDDITSKLGGGWLQAATIWKGTDSPYLILIANNPTRIARAAPMALMVVSESDLEWAIGKACTLLDDVKCLWMRLLDSPAMDAVGKVILADAIPQGVA